MGNHSPGVSRCGIYHGLPGITEVNYIYVPMMPYGKERRKFIKDLFNANPDGHYAVNCKHRPQVKEDPDLKKLIRVGFLKQIRECRFPSSNITYLVKA
jgi:hypothetical protein